MNMPEYFLIFTIRDKFRIKESLYCLSMPGGIRTDLFIAGGSLSLLRYNRGLPLLFP